MCKSQAEGGQRCSAHTRPAFEAAKRSLNQALASGDLAQVGATWERYDKVAAEHASTQAGQAEIMELAREAATRGDQTEAGFMFNAAARGRDIRERNAEAAARIQAARVLRAREEHTWTGRDAMVTGLAAVREYVADGRAGDLGIPAEITFVEGIAPKRGWLKENHHGGVDLVDQRGRAIVANVYGPSNNNLTAHNVASVTVNPATERVTVEDLRDDMDMGNGYGDMISYNPSRWNDIYSATGTMPEANAIVLAHPAANRAEKEMALRSAGNLDWSSTDHLTRWNAVFGAARIVENADGTYSRDTQQDAYLFAHQTLTWAKSNDRDHYEWYTNVFDSDYNEGIGYRPWTAPADNHMLARLREQAHEQIA